MTVDEKPDGVLARELLRAVERSRSGKRAGFGATLARFDVASIHDARAAEDEARSNSTPRARPTQALEYPDRRQEIRSVTPFRLLLAERHADERREVKDCVRPVDPLRKLRRVDYVAPQVLDAADRARRVAQIEARYVMPVPRQTTA